MRAKGMRACPRFRCTRGGRWSTRLRLHDQTDGGRQYEMKWNWSNKVQEELEGTLEKYERRLGKYFLLGKNRR